MLAVYSSTTPGRMKRTLGPSMETLPVGGSLLDCGGKRSATPLLEITAPVNIRSFSESGVAAALCRRTAMSCVNTEKRSAHLFFFF
jgi:hypothetical protein